MSLAPLLHPDIRGVEGKRHPVAKTCCAPGCISASQEGHHMWSRSFLRGQPTEWVKLPTGAVVSNVVGLCSRHHRQVTGQPGGHWAMIRCEPDGTFVWLSMVACGWQNEGVLAPQPFGAEPVPEKSHPPTHANLAEGETCPSCGYTRPRKNGREALPARPSKSWNVIVPDDAEIGADVLDEWIEQFAVILGFEGGVKQRLVRYHVTAVVLAWAMQRRADFIHDISEAAEA